VSDPYEPPAAPDLTIKTNEEEPQESARKVIEKLGFYDYLKPPWDRKNTSNSQRCNNNQSVSPA
jgi:hypothetical protein